MSSLEQMDKKYGSTSKPKQQPASKSPIAHNFNPNSDQQTRSDYQSGAKLNDTDQQLNNQLLEVPKSGKKKSVSKRVTERLHDNDSKQQMQRSVMSTVSKRSQASKRSNKSMAQGQKMVTFRELMEMKRVQENSHMGPGVHDTLKPFGSGLNKIDFGTKYKFKPGNNPGPGQYEPSGAVKLVHPSSYEAFIKDSRKMSMVDPNPDAGQYDPHKQFGDIPQKMTWQGKYKFKPDSNPPPGYYDPEKAEGLVRPKSSSYRQSAEKRNKKITSDVPEAGQYDPHKPFGDISQKMTWQGKYNFKPDSNPPPGLYDPIDTQTKHMSPSVSFRKERKKDSLYEAKQMPAPGQYDRHLKPFGDMPQKMTWQGKYQFKPDSNPPPGLYDADISLTKSSLPRAKSAHIRKKMYEGGPQEIGPSPGDYDSHLKPFGDLPQRMTWKGKYKFQPNSNPPPGYYDPERANELTKPRSSSYSPSKQAKSTKVQSDVPEGGQYDPDKGFANIPNKMTLGGKYKWKASDTPGPGTYEADKACDTTKAYSPSARMHQPVNQMPYQEKPGPQVYDGYLKPMGYDLNNINMGNKYKFGVNDVPPPGYYNPERADPLVRERSPAARITQEALVAVDADAIPVYLTANQKSNRLENESTPKPLKQAPRQLEENPESDARVK